MAYSRDDLIADSDVDKQAHHAINTKEKNHANSRIRRRSDAEKKNKKEKDDKEKERDTDTDSLISAASTTPSTSYPSKCPLCFLLSGMIEAEDGKQTGCLLRRVQLWHAIPLCLLAIINLLPIIVALLGFAGYKITMGVQRVVVGMLKSDLEVEPYVEKESVGETDGGTLVES
ncbi:hypothetical protein DSL72_004962 [Monilinia vaccinii-corymbosi]|uniref:Uncharacterized protein n=1 Tax=Monilinia vaccinii-corymbosi TaxID=61207 RepID=A0A8A3P978_9HELO|nr:hypothetical protein DSL72_004962 [Monilinia vaccinii-corymbosi]